MNIKKWNERVPLESRPSRKAKSNGLKVMKGNSKLHQSIYTIHAGEYKHIRGIFCKLITYY